MLQKRVQLRTALSRGGMMLQELAAGGRLEANADVLLNVFDGMANIAHHLESSNTQQAGVIMPHLMDSVLVLP